MEKQDLRISRYRILRPLGSGGMGEVYAAEDERLRRKVAIKLIAADKASDSEARQRFEREAQAASALNHPNICTIFEINDHEGQPFLVMEYLEGQERRAHHRHLGAQASVGECAPKGIAACPGVVKRRTVGHQAKKSASLRATGSRTAKT